MIRPHPIFGDLLAATSSAPLSIEAIDAEGIFIFDSKGKKYTDLISGISVSNAGHKNPDIIKAIKNQASQYTHLMVYGEYIQSPQIDLAKLLASLLPDSLQCTYFVNSGTEAIEGAMKLAKRYTGRTEIISCFNAYHGSSQGALSVMGSEAYKQAFRPLIPDTRLIRFNNIDDLEHITHRTACVIIEPIQAEAGVIIPDNGYLEALRLQCKKTDTLLVFDEIQTGIGRTGKLFGFEHSGVIPDIITLAKAFGGGLPLGAFIASKEIMQCLSHKPVLGHLTTFGGNPVCCAAGLAGLNFIIKNKLHLSAKDKGKIFKSNLKHHSIKEIRHSGLLIALDFDEAKVNQAVIAKCLEKGIITDWFLFNEQSMRIAPPLIITEQEIKTACHVIMEAVSEVL